VKNEIEQKEKNGPGPIRSARLAKNRAKEIKCNRGKINGTYIRASRHTRGEQQRFELRYRCRILGDLLLATRVTRKMNELLVYNDFDLSATFVRSRIRLKCRGTALA
jgi:hypothetical protein